ncbi:hypothetical protein BH09MYX1_BH09MYX1_27590 [soil metagenome]
MTIRFSLSCVLFSTAALSATALGACAPAVGLGSDDVLKDAAPQNDAAPQSDAGADANVVTSEFPRIDIRVTSGSRGWPISGQVQDGVTVSVSYFKTPTALTDVQGATGCSDRFLTQKSTNPNLGLTGFGKILGTVRVGNGAPVPLALQPNGAYVTELGLLPESTEVTIDIDPSAKEIGGRSYIVKTKLLELVAPVPFAFVKGQPYSVTWKHIEGPLLWAVSDGETIPSSQEASHYVDCWGPAGTGTSTTIDSKLFDGLDWSQSATSGTFVVQSTRTAQTAVTPGGATVNLFNEATYAAAFHVQ